MVPELAIRYDNNLRPTSAQCSTCGQHMPTPPSEVRDTADVLMWFGDIATSRSMNDWDCVADLARSNFPARRISISSFSLVTI